MKQQEQVEWDDVNKLLQHQGFKPVFFADPVENKNLSDLVLLDKKSAGEVRTTLKTMLTDSDRRQALIQELAKSNNQLKEEAQKHMNRAAQQSQRITELEALLDQVTTRVQDLEDRYLGKAVQQHSYTQQLQQGQAEAEKRCQLLELKLRKKEEEAAQIQRKLHFALREEEQRLARQSQTFQNICRKLFQPRSAADQQVMDVIDYYETKLSHLLEELRSAKEEADGSKKTSTSVTPSFTTILQSFQEQQKEASRQVEELKRDVDRLKQELDTRPTLKEVKFYKHKLRRLEGLNRSMNTRHGTNEMTERTGDESSGCQLCDQYHHLLAEIAGVVTDPNAPLRLRRPNASSQRSDPADFQVLLPILEERAQQLHLLKDLQHSINKLTVKLLPWQPHKGNVADGVKVEDLMVLVDAMLENFADDEQKLRSPTRYTLASMVSHFQKLFDIRSLSGVFPRMNEVYTRLGEMTNAMRNLRDVLNLDNRVPAAEVVNQVARLVSSNTAALQDLQGEADINSIILKVKQHDEFFPAFHALVTEMLLVLGVTHLDDVLPAVKSLKETQ